MCAINAASCTCMCVCVVAAAAAWPFGNFMETDTLSLLVTVAFNASFALQPNSHLNIRNAISFVCAVRLVFVSFRTFVYFVWLDSARRFVRFRRFTHTHTHIENRRAYWCVVRVRVYILPVKPNT